MPKAVVFSDLHLESGAHLGSPDPVFGNTRLRDAEAVLAAIAGESCDVLIFAGDMGRTAAPSPMAYRMLQDALRNGAAAGTVLVLGNHDHLGPSSESSSCLHVVSRALPRVKVFDRAALTIAPGGIQLGVLPWTPPARLFAQAPHKPREMNRLVAEKLVDVARGLGRQLDPSKPSLLCGHWAVMGPSNRDVMELFGEPVLDALDLEASGPWDACVFGHYHHHGQLSDRVWHCGAPMRGGFGDDDRTGYMVIEW